MVFGRNQSFDFEFQLEPDSGSSMATSPLQARAIEVRNTRVNWQPYVQSNMITKEEYEVILKIDNQGQRKAALSTVPDQCVATLVSLMTKISKDQTVQYIVTLIDDILQEERSRVELFRQFASKNKESVWRPFFDMLHRPDPYTINQASRIIAKIACWSKMQMEENDLVFYMNWIIKDQMKTGEFLQSVVRCLQMLLRIRQYRKVFVNLKGIEAISDLLHGKIGYQVQYQLIFCLWILTYDVQIVNKISKLSLIPVMADILSDAAKEKVVRIILATFRNLLEKPSENEYRLDNSMAMIRSKVLKQLSLLETKKYEDIDVIEDIKAVSDTLNAMVQNLSSFDEYSSELKSGQLEWSPVHKSEKFWRENAARLNENNFELLKILARLLEMSQDPLVLCVASHDIGEYVRHYPHGKTVVEQLGCKTFVMGHLGHEDPNVRYEALLAVQKLMVHNWEYLEKKLDTTTKDQTK